jgi:hypothetical protein
MSLLPRGSKRALPTLVLLTVITLLAIPVTWAVRAPWTAIGPSVVWAGSPDETLSPPPAPPKPAKKANSVLIHREEAPVYPGPALSKVDALSNAVSTRYFLYVLWRVSLATAVRY